MEHSFPILLCVPQPAATGEFALSTLASVSASKLKEKLREKLASGGAASQTDSKCMKSLKQLI